jgi:hypothetical protein
VPVQKFRSAEEAELAMIKDPKRGTPRQLRAAFSWFLALKRIAPEQPTFHGVRRYRSIAEAAADRSSGFKRSNS